MSFKKIKFEVEKRNLDNTKAYTKEELSIQGYMVPVQTAPEPDPENKQQHSMSSDEGLKELIQQIVETEELSVIVHEDPKLNMNSDEEAEVDLSATAASKKKPTKKSKKT